jgi:hypothetical protein
MVRLVVSGVRIVVRPWRAAVEPLHYRFFKHEMAYMNVAAAGALWLQRAPPPLG